MTAFGHLKDCRFSKSVELSRDKHLYEVLALSVSRYTGKKEMQFGSF